MKNLTLFYDVEADILEISAGLPRSAVSHLLQDDCLIRLDPVSKEIIGLSILNFKGWARTAKTPKALPLQGEFRLHDDKTK